jgi:hypothetical protein
MPSKIIAGLVPKSPPPYGDWRFLESSVVSQFLDGGRDRGFEVEYEDEDEDGVEIDCEIKLQSVDTEVSSANPCGRT